MTAEGTSFETSTAGRIVIGVVIAAAVVLGAVAIWKGRGDNGLGQDCKYDISDYMKTDPGLILYREVKQRCFDTGLAEARAIATGPDGRIYVAGDRAVRIFDATGGNRSALDMTDRPRAVTVGTNGWLYVAFKDHAAIHKPDGSVAELPVAAPVATTLLTSIAVRGPDIYVADAGNRSVLHYRKLDLVGRIGARDSRRGIRGFNVPSPYFDVAVDSAGSLQVADPGRHRIVSFTREGKSNGSWASRRSPKIEDFCGCCNPVNFAITPAGEFVTTEKGLARVKLYSAHGAFLGVVAGAESFPDHDPTALAGDVGPVLDVAVDAQGRVLVLDCRTGWVRTFERTEASAE